MAKRSKRRANGEGTVFERGDGRWQAVLTVPGAYDAKGRLVRRYVYGRTQKEALAKLEAAKQSLAVGSLDLSKERVSDFLTRWLADRERRVKPTTHWQYTHAVHKLIVPRIGKLKLSAVTPGHVQRLVDDVADASGVPSAGKARSVLYSAFKWATKLQIVQRNPVESVDALPQAPKAINLWRPDEAARFLDVARSDRLFAFFYVLMGTGLRRGEILALTWADIQGDSLSVTKNRVKRGSQIITQSPKTAKGTRRIALAPDVVEVLNDHRHRQEAEREALGVAWADTTGLVFTSVIGTPLDPDNLTRTRRRLMKQAGVPEVTFHDLRHLHASVGIRNGVDAKSLADRLGHSRASFTLDRYVSLFEEQRELAAVSLAAWLPQRVAN